MRESSARRWRQANSRVSDSFEAVPRLEPIFIQGLMHRTGTNYLYTLLCLHPHVARGLVIYEDYLSHRADLLHAYARETFQKWNPEWRVAERVGAPETLTARLGDALLDFLRLQFAPPNAPLPPHKKQARFFVTKTPGVQNLEYFFELFPRVPLILLVRDGRAVVESGMRSFHWDFETATRQWAAAARTVQQFVENPAAQGKRFLLVHYERVFEQPQPEMQRILNFLALDTHVYDWARAQELPVSGSSEVRAMNGADVHWKPVARAGDFAPTRRWEHWTRAQHERFNWLAGDMLTYLGYTPRVESTRRRYWTWRNRWLDWQGKLRF